jgi:hypothetical protein
LYDDIYIIDRMSYLYKCTQQYIGHTETFPTNSFLISGVSFYTDAVRNVTNKTTLTAIAEPDNPYDSNAIKIMNGTEQVGYVPKGSQPVVTNGQSLRVFHIKGGGIRVVPE